MKPMKPRAAFLFLALIFIVTGLAISALGAPSLGFGLLCTALGMGLTAGFVAWMEGDADA